MISSCNPGQRPTVLSGASPRWWAGQPERPRGRGSGREAADFVFVSVALSQPQGSEQVPFPGVSWWCRPTTQSKTSENISLRGSVTLLSFWGRPGARSAQPTTGARLQTGQVASVQGASASRAVLGAEQHQDGVCGTSVMHRHGDCPALRFCPSSCCFQS